jgi:PAP2 superfamily
VNGSKSSCHGRGRARYPLSIDYGNSFPSGHVTSAATIFGAGYYFLGKPCGGQWWRRHLAIVGVVGMVSVIAFQRVYFTHHWLSDVVGGALLGTGWCFLPSIVFLAVQIGGQSSPGSYYSPAPFSLSDCSLCSGSTTQRPWLGAAIRQASWISPPMRPIRLSDDTAGCAWGERLKDLAFLQADDDRRSAIGAERRILFDVCCATARSARKCRLSKNRPGAQ